jgi:hypothetical protein
MARFPAGSVCAARFDDETSRVADLKRQSGGHHRFRLMKEP